MLALEVGGQPHMPICGTMTVLAAHARMGVLGVERVLSGVAFLAGLPPLVARLDLPSLGHGFGAVVAVLAKGGGYGQLAGDAGH